MKKFVLAVLLLAFVGSDLFARDIDSIIASMTPREKIAQLIYVAVDSQESPERTAHEPSRPKSVSLLFVNLPHCS